MASDAVRTATDWLKNFVSAGARVTAGGKLQLAVPNEVLDASFGDLGADNAPVGVDVVRGPRDDGYHFYATKANRQQTALSRQTFFPEGPETDLFQFGKEIFGGAPLPRPNDLLADLRARPQKGWVTKKSVARVGFKAATYWYAVSVIGQGGSHTETTEPVQFTHTGTGRAIKCPLPMEMPQGGVKFGIWLSEPDKDPESMRLQDTVKPGKAEHPLYGPLKTNSRKRPEKNETAVGKPKEPKWGQPRKQDIWRGSGHGHHDLKTPMRVRIVIVETTRIGDSDASPVSKHRDIKERTRMVRVRNEKGELVRSKGDPILKENGDPKLDENGNPMYQNNGDVKLREVNSDIRNEAIWVKPDKLHPESTGFKVFAQIDDVPNPPWYQLVRGAKTDKTHRFQKGDAVPITGQVDQGEDGGRKRDPKHPWHVLVPADPPIEDTSGIESPTGETDVPYSFGPTRPGPGTYWYTHTRVLNGLQTLAAPPVKVTISGDGSGAATEVAVYHVPPMINKISNSMFGRVDETGEPADWTVNQTGSVFTMPEPGIARLLTTTQISDAGRYPNIQTEDMYRVAGNRIETIRGILINEEVGTGFVELGLIQYNEDGVLVGADEAASTLVISSLAATAIQESEVAARVAKADVPGADFVLHDDAAFARVKAYARGNPRSVRFSVRNIAWHPFDGAPRKIIFPERGSRTHAIATNDAEVPYRSRHVIGFMLPPAVKSSSASVPPPIDNLNFDADLGGMGIFKSVNNANTSAARDVAASLNSTGQGFRVKNDHTNSRSLIYGFKSYDAPWNRYGAVRTRVRLTRLPTASSAETSVLSIMCEDSTSDPVRRIGMIYVKRWPNNTKVNLHFTAYNNKGDRVATRKIAEGLNANAVLDVELLSGYGGGEDSVSVNVGINGGSVDTVGTIIAGNLPGTGPAVMRLGVDYQDRNCKYTFDYDDVFVTERGYFPAALDSPALVPLTQADRPTRDGVVLRDSAVAETFSLVTDSATAGLLVRLGVTSASAGVVTILAALRTDLGTNLVRIEEAADGKINVVAPGYSRQVRAPFAATDSGNLEMVVKGAGTKGGSVLVYVGTGAGRKLLAAKSGLDLSAGLVGQAFSGGRAGIAVQQALVTERGSIEIVDVDHNGDDIFQGYVSINPLNVVNRDVGTEFEEIVVRPGEWNTWAVRIRTENFPPGCQPLMVALYNDAGDRYIAARLFGADGVSEGSTPWEDRAVFFQPRAGYHRCRIESAKMDGGTYIYQQPLRVPGQHTTVAARDAQRAKLVSVKGEAETILGGFVPEVGVGPMQQDYSEEWLRLLTKAEEPEGDQQTATSNATTDRLSVSAHGYAANGTVRVIADSGGSLPGGLAANTTYFVHTPTANDFGLAATEAGTAIDITSAGSNFSVYGVTSVNATYRSTNADPPTSWESAFLANPDDVPQDRKWANVKLVLRGDGKIWPTVSPGGVELLWKCFQPTMLREDGSPFPGGTTVAGLIRVTEDSERDTTPVAGRARARRLHEPVPKYDHPVEVHFYHPQAFEEFMNDPYAVRQIDHPAANTTVRVKPYEVGEPAYFESELFEETLGFVQVTVPITRLEVIETAPLVPDDEVEIGGDPWP